MLELQSAAYFIGITHKVKVTKKENNLWYNCFLGDFLVLKQFLNLLNSTFEFQCFYKTMIQGYKFIAHFTNFLNILTTIYYFPSTSQSYLDPSLRISLSILKLCSISLLFTAQCTYYSKKKRRFQGTFFTQLTLTFQCIRMHQYFTS